MDQKEYSVPRLLQDIRELLLGIALILVAIALILLGLALRNDVNSEILYWIAGPVVLAYGGFHTWNGWTRREVIEKNDESPKQGK